ncbi:hypothetical protein GQ457_14G013330 [Hibiscus cannabinus]
MLNRVESQSGIGWNRPPSSTVATAHFCSVRRFGNRTPPTCSSRPPLSFSRISFPRRGPKLRESAPIPSGFVADDRYSGERSGRLRTSTEPPRRPLSFYQLSFPRHSPKLGENGFETLDSSSPDLLRPPSDRNENEICCSPSTGQASDRWDSPFAAPITGNRKGQDGILSGGDEEWVLVRFSEILFQASLVKLEWGVELRVKAGGGEVKKMEVEHAAGKEQRRAKGLLVLAEARVAEAGGQSARTRGWWCRNHGAATMHERQHVELGLVLMGYFGCESDAKSSYNVELMFAASFDSKMGCLYSVFDVKKQGKPIWKVRTRNWKL